MPQDKVKLEDISNSDKNSLMGQSFKNKFINPRFKFWQEDGGLSLPGPTSYSADQWRYLSNSISGITDISKENFITGQSEVPNNPQHYVRLRTGTSTNAASHYLILNQPIENVSTLAGKAATLSFYAKADTNRSLSIEAIQSFGTGGSPSTEVQTFIQKISLTATWQKITVTFNVPSISGKTIGSNGIETSRLDINLYLSAGTDYNSRTSSLGIQTGASFYFAEMQLEEGEDSTSFEIRPDAIEFSLCQRFLEVGNLSPDSEFFPTTAQNIGLIGILVGTTLVLCGPSFKVQKRVAPTMVFASTTSGAGLVRNYTQGADYSVSSYVATKSNLLSIVLSAPSTIGHVIGAQWKADSRY